MSLKPNPMEQARRNEVMKRIISDSKAGKTIKLPDFDPNLSKPAESALLTVGQMPNPFNGTIGPFRYQFEGEEDLLHLIVTRIDEEILTPENGQWVASFLLNGVPPALIWLKPGRFSQHFYVGHDDLFETLIL